MFALKPISRDSIPGALAKAERYRLLHEPGEAESICRDILEVDPQNHDALVSLILSLTDQIPDHPGVFQTALSTITRLPTPYDRAYYAGIAWERRAKARYKSTSHGSHDHVYEWIVQAMDLFEQAEATRPPNNDDPILRRNACVRFLKAHKDVAPRPAETPEPVGSE
jgi:hypothetical protein